MTSTVSSNDNSVAQSQLRETLAALDVRRRALELEAQAITSELTTTSPTQDDDGQQVPPMGIDTPLVDADGYPRGDIDLYRARSLRGRLAEIRTDHRQIMRQIERLLPQQWAAGTNHHNNNHNTTDTTDTTPSNAVVDHERAARAAPKPKPKYDAVTGKWVVPNWDGSVAGSTQDDDRPFESIGVDGSSNAAAAATATVADAEHTATTTTTTTAPPQQPMSQLTLQQHQQQPQSTTTTTTAAATPWARVNAVAPASPAATAGLQEGDLIVQFGHVRNHNNDDGSVEHDVVHSLLLSQVAQLVPEAAGRQASIEIVVQRLPGSRDATFEGTTTTTTDTTSSTVTVQLRPRPWNGRGLLGCHIVPLE